MVIIKARTNDRGDNGAGLEDTGRADPGTAARTRPDANRLCRNTGRELSGGLKLGARCCAAGVGNADAYRRTVWRIGRRAAPNGR